TGVELWYAAQIYWFSRSFRWQAFGVVLLIYWILGAMWCVRDRRGESLDSGPGADHDRIPLGVAGIHGSGRSIRSSGGAIRRLAARGSLQADAPVEVTTHRRWLASSRPMMPRK